MFLFFRYFWHLVDHFFYQLKMEVKSSLVNPNSSNLLLVSRQNDLKICESPTWFRAFLIALIFRPLQVWIRWLWTRTLQLLQHRLESIVTKVQQVLNLKNFIMKTNFPKEVTMVMASMLMDQNLVRNTLFIADVPISFGLKISKLRNQTKKFVKLYVNKLSRIFLLLWFWNICFLLYSYPKLVGTSCTVFENWLKKSQNIWWWFSNIVFIFILLFFYCFFLLSLQVSYIRFAQ